MEARSGYPRHAEVDIRKGADYLEGVVLETPPVHTMTIDPTSLVEGSSIRLSWEPNGDTRVNPAVWIWTVEPFEAAFEDYDLLDTGSYESPMPAFMTAGRHEVNLIRDLPQRLNSQYSIAFASVLIDEVVERQLIGARKNLDLVASFARLEDQACSGWRRR